MVRTTRTFAFTIVELLIVIVVIAILAAISVVAYNGIQQRSKNSAIISAASQSYKVIQAYLAAEGSYPLTTNSAACITSASGCQANSTADNTVPVNSTFDTNMARLGTLPRSVPFSGTRLFGITYGYASTATMNGSAQPAWLLYYLEGTNQPCGLIGVTNDSSYPTLTSSTNPYTSGNDGGLNKTRCRITIPGPSS